MSRSHKLPAGWDDARVRDLIAHYDSQSEDEQAAEIEAALAGPAGRDNKPAAATGTPPGPG